MTSRSRGRFRHDGGVRPQARAVRRRRGRSLPARVRERRQPGPGHLLRALSATRRSSRSRPTSASRPRRSSTSPPAAFRRGTTSPRSACSADAARAADLHRHVHHRRPAAPHPYLARWQVFPANPPLTPLPAYPWGNPSTDTRELWCWESGDAADCDRVVGNLASRGPWDYNFKANAPTLTTIGNNANDGHVVGRTRSCRARRSSGRRARPGTTCTRGRTTGTSAAASRRRAPPDRPGTTRRRR